MAVITRPCYSNRGEMMRAVDFHPGVDQNAATDRALQSAADNIDGQLHRVFYPLDATMFFDWPNQGGAGGGQYASPWRLWFDQWDCCALTALVTGGQSISLDQVFLEPVNRLPGWPFTYLELDRSSTAAFGGNAQTPQHAIAGTGTWGFGADASQVATLTADVATGTTTITVSDSSQAGPGDLLVLGYGRGTAPFPAAAGYAGSIAPYLGERVLVTGQSWADSGQAQVSGCATESDADNTLAVTDGTTFAVGEVIKLGSEQMLITDITGNSLDVRRAWNATVLAVHGGAEIWVARQLTVARAQLGTSAASYTSGAPVHKHQVPNLVRDLSIAEAVNQVLQEGSGYARTVGSGESATPAPGVSLADKWDETRTVFGRKARIRGV